MISSDIFISSSKFSFFLTEFVIKGSETYFYKNPVDKLLESIKPGNSVIYYKQKSDIHCIEEEGMPYFNSPIIKGDLYMIFNIVFPEKITIDNDVLSKTIKKLILSQRYMVSSTFIFKSYRVSLRFLVSISILLMLFCYHPVVYQPPKV